MKNEYEPKKQNRKVTYRIKVNENGCVAICITAFFLFLTLIMIFGSNG